MKTNALLAAALLPLFAAAASAQTPNGDAEIVQPLKPISGIPGKMLQEAPRGDAEIVSSGRSEAKATHWQILMQAAAEAKSLANAHREGSALARTKEWLSVVSKAAESVAVAGSKLDEQLARLKSSPRIGSGSSEAESAKAAIADAERAVSMATPDGHARADSSYDYELMMNNRYGNVEAVAADAAVDAALADLERAVIESRAMGAEVTRYLRERGALESCECAQIKSDPAGEIAAKKAKWQQAKARFEAVASKRSFVFEAGADGAADAKAGCSKP